MDFLFLRLVSNVWWCIDSTGYCSCCGFMGSWSGKKVDWNSTRIWKNEQMVSVESAGFRVPDTGVFSKSGRTGSSETDTHVIWKSGSKNSFFKRNPISGSYHPSKKFFTGRIDSGICTWADAFETSWFAGTVFFSGYICHLLVCTIGRYLGTGVNRTAGKPVWYCSL